MRKSTHLLKSLGTGTLEGQTIEGAEYSALLLNQDTIDYDVTMQSVDNRSEENSEADFILEPD